MPDPAKVGLIFIVFVVVALVSLLYLTGQAGWLSGRHMAVHFPDVEGLTEGAKVLLAGKEIGRVLRIDLASEEDLKRYPDHAVVVHLSIEKGVVLYDTDEFTIAQAGMLGDTNIVVRRLSREQREEQARLFHKPVVEPKALGADAHVSGTRIVGLTELGADARGVLQQVKGAIADFQQVYAGPDVRRQLPLIMANVEAATRNAVAFSEALARVSAQNEAKIGQIATQIAAASVELNRSAVRVREMIAAGAPNIERSTARVARMLDVSAANIEGVSASLARTSTRVERLVGTSAEDIEATTRLARETLERSSDNIQKTAAHVAGASEAVEATARSAGEDLAATTRRVRELVEGSAGNVERAAAQVEKSTAALASLVETSSKDLSASTARVNQMVQVSAGDVEKTSANLARLSEGMLADLSAVTGRARGMVEKSSADIERTTGRIAQMAQQSADDIERTTRRLHDLVALSPLPSDLAATGAHIRAASEHIEKITSAVEATVADPQFGAQLRTIVANLQASSEHLLEMTRQAEALAGEGRQVTGELKGLVGDTRVAINTTSTNLNNEAMWADIRATTSQLRQAMDDLAALTAQGRKILTDPTVAQNITDSIANVRTLTEQGIEVAKKADRSLTRVDETMDRVTNVAHSIQPDATGMFFGLQGGEHSGLRADVGADLFYGEGLDSFWRVGLRDVGDAEGLILQRGLGLNSGGTLRMGIYGSKLSLGLDWPLSTRVAAELNLWNPNDPRLDVAAGLHLRHNWDLLFGANELLSKTDPFVGLRRSLRPPAKR